MKIFKRIVYTLLGLLIAGTVALVGIILYAEYSGKRFTPDSAQTLAQLDSPEDESRLVYDENDNLIELPKIQESEEESDSADRSGTDSSEPSANEPETASSEDTADHTDSAAAPVTDAATAGADTERPYVMDLGSALFHTPDCPYAANIAADKRSEMTTTSAKIMNAGYLPCTNCHPDTAGADASADASSSVAVSNELSY